MQYILLTGYLTFGAPHITKLLAVEIQIAPAILGLLWSIQPFNVTKFGTWITVKFTQQNVSSGNMKQLQGIPTVDIAESVD